MRISTIVTSCFVLCFFWLAGIALGEAHINRETAEREQAYWPVMKQAIEGLKQSGVAVSYPEQLPPILACSTCLNQREAFGAYADTIDQVIVPDDFDVTTIRGRAALIHEYGHYLLTKAGVPAEAQEELCLKLGNSVYQKFFRTASLTE